MVCDSIRDFVTNGASATGAPATFVETVQACKDLVLEQDHQGSEHERLVYNASNDKFYASYGGGTVDMTHFSGSASWKDAFEKLRGLTDDVPTDISDAALLACPMNPERCTVLGRTRAVLERLYTCDETRGLLLDDSATALKMRAAAQALFSCATDNAEYGTISMKLALQNITKASGGERPPRGSPEATSQIVQALNSGVALLNAFANQHSQRTFWVA